MAARTVVDEIKQTRPFRSKAQETAVAVLRTASAVRRRFEAEAQKEGLTLSQYNVLRILRGAYPEGYPRYEIIDRLIRRAPDVTRLLDRLERQELVERVRSSEDRRLSITRITKGGLALLDAIEPERVAVQNELASRLTEDDLRELARLVNHLVP